MGSGAFHFIILHLCKKDKSFTILTKAVTYCLLFLFSVAFSYETISCFSEKTDSDFQVARNDYEAENDTESDDENEKKESLEDLYFHPARYLSVFSQSKASLFTHFTFSSSDYSQTVYSPPEQLATL